MGNLALVELFVAYLCLYQSLLIGSGSGHILGYMAARHDPCVDKGKAKPCGLDRIKWCGSPVRRLTVWCGLRSSIWLYIYGLHLTPAFALNT